MAKLAPEEYFRTDEIRSDLSGRAARGGAYVGVAQALRGVIEVLTLLVLVRLLTPADFGLIGMVIAVTSFIELFKDLGLSMATIQKEDVTHRQVSALFWINALAGVVLAALTAGVAPLVAMYYGEPALLEITLTLAIGLVFGGLGVQHRAVLTRRMRFGAIAGVDLGAIVLGGLVAAVLAWQGFTYWALVAKILVSAGAGMIGAWLACGWRPGPPRRDPALARMLSFGGHLAGFNIVNYFARNLDDILIGKYFGATSLALYQKAYELLMMPLTQLNAPVGRIAVPALSRIVDEPERYRQAYLRLLEKVLMLAMPMGGFLIACSDSIVFVVLGPQWTDASAMFAVLGVLVFAQPIGNATGWLFISQGRTDELMRWGVLGAALAVASFIVGLQWGVLGVAACYAITGPLVRMPTVVYLAGRTGPVSASDIYRCALPLALSGLATLAALLGYRALIGEQNHWLVLAGALPLALAVAVGVLAAMPRGRAALVDLWAMARQALGRKKIEVEVESEVEVEK